MNLMRMRRSRSRVVAVGGLAVGAAAGLFAIVTALGAPTSTISQAKAADATITYHPVSFGHDSVGVQHRPGNLLCFTVDKGSSTVGRSCTSGLSSDQIEYASSRYAVGGLAGASVRAVIVRLTRKGTVWATLRDGAFLAEIPKGYNVRAVVKVLQDGSRTAFTVTGPR
jgi:hypothetical protein